MVICTNSGVCGAGLNASKSKLVLSSSDETVVVIDVSKSFLLNDAI